MQAERLLHMHMHMHMYRTCTCTGQHVHVACTFEAGGVVLHLDKLNSKRTQARQEYPFVSSKFKTHSIFSTLLARDTATHALRRKAPFPKKNVWEGGQAHAAGGILMDAHCDCPHHHIVLIFARRELVRDRKQRRVQALASRNLHVKCPLMNFISPIVIGSSIG